ncbi:MAG: thiosulfate sulfurtransferase GlpE [Psychromonas sp.]|nr:thiosulfate sulfurtransferase GlpE [Psychromonas sp.]
MAEFKCISVHDAMDRMQNETVKCVDIRDLGSFATEHVEGAFNLNNENINQFISETDFKTTLFVICYSGVGSKGVAQYLVEQGFIDTYSITGGFLAWKEARSNE